MQVKAPNLKKFLRNIYHLMTYDFHKNIEDNKNQNEAKIATLEKKLTVMELLNYYYANSDMALNYKSELAYLLENKTDIVFPYRQINKIENIRSGYDNSLKLPYIIHNGKKLYFPSSLSIKNAELTYRNFIEMENITGIGEMYREKHPHKYQSDTFFIKEDDVFFDIGCAEALLTLDVIDKIKKAYLVESDPMWLDALKATFRPYKDKVIIIDKLISDVDTDTTITLPSLLKNEKESSVFIKMDIEGYETSVIEASKEFLLGRQNIRIACCTYHRQNDADTLARIFSNLHYEIEYSDGYILFIYDELKPPYFRKGIIRATKR